MDNKLIEGFPLWHSWLRQFRIPEVDRKGVPKGERYPIGGRKFEAAATLLLYSKGINTTDEVAQLVGVGGPVLRNWRSEDRFKDLIKSLEIDFANFVLKSFQDPATLERLYLHDEQEPMCWSDGVLKVIMFNLAEDSREIREREYLVRQRKKLVPPLMEPGDVPKLSIWDALEISPREGKALRLKERIIPKDPICSALVDDIFWAASFGFQAFKGDFKKQVRLTKTIDYSVPLLGLAETLQITLLSRLEDAVKTDKPKNEIAELIDQCKRSAFLLSRKLGERRFKIFQGMLRNPNPLKEERVEARTNEARKGKGKTRR